MAHQLKIDINTLNNIFGPAPREFLPLLRWALDASAQNRKVTSPRNQYPLFEHLLVFLYSRWFSTNVPKANIFGGDLTRLQKTNLGEAIDLVLYLNLVPVNIDIGVRLSLLGLCHHEKYGFRDDPVLLQRMWYLRSFVLLLDSPNGPQEGERWKWYDSRLTLVIYSWVRHNRKYHGCPRVACTCRAMIEEYGMGIKEFKQLYMALQTQCTPQLHFIRMNDSMYQLNQTKDMSKVPRDQFSRALTSKIYIDPRRKEWPSCLVSQIPFPDTRNPPANPEATAPAPEAAASSSAPPTAPKASASASASTSAAPATPSQTAPQEQPSQPTVSPPPPYSTIAFTSVTVAPAPTGGLPPPHPSLPARPTGPQTYTFVQQNPAALLAERQGVLSTRPLAPAPTLPAPQRSLAPIPTGPVKPDPPKSQPASYATRSAVSSNPATTSTGQPPSPTSNRFNAQPPSGPRARMFPSSSATETSTQQSQSAAGWSTTVNAATTPSSAMSTPSMDPISPTLPNAIPEPSSSPTSLRLPTSQALSAPTPIAPTASTTVAPPTAPRSMRNIKSNGPIPTGPRAMTGGGANSGGSTPGGNVSNMAGVPSGPRALRNLAAARKTTGPGTDSQGDVTMENGESQAPPSSLVAAWESPSRANRGPAATADGEAPSSLSASHIKAFKSALPKNPENEPIAPPVPLSSLGKRSRDETKEDEVVADKEMQNVDTTPKSRSPVVVPSSLPPSKRPKVQAEPESPTKKIVPMKKRNINDGNVLGLENGTATAPSKPPQPIIILDSDEDIDEPITKKPTSKSSSKPASSETASRSSSRLSAIKDTTPASKKTATKSTTRSSTPKTSTSKTPVVDQASKETSTFEADFFTRKPTQMQAQKEKGGEKDSKSKKTKDVMDKDDVIVEEIAESEDVYIEDLGGASPPQQNSYISNDERPVDQSSWDPIVIQALQKGPPYPTISISSHKPRRQDPEAEIVRIMCVLGACEIPSEPWMLQVGKYGTAVRDQAVPFLLPSFTRERLADLKRAGIDITISPSDDSDSEDESGNTPASFIPSTLAHGAAPVQQITIFDGYKSRRIESVELEEKRLREQVEMILGIPLSDVTRDNAPVEHCGCKGVLRLVFSPEFSKTLNDAAISRLGHTGLVVYNGDMQVSGLVLLPSQAHSQPTTEAKPFDWKAMRAEVLKMRLPWEASFASTSDSSLASPAPSSSFSVGHRSTHSSSSSVGKSVTATARANVWSTSKTFSRMAAAGMRWGEFTGVDPESSDEGSDEEAAHQRGQLRSEIVW